MTVFVTILMIKLFAYVNFQLVAGSIGEHKGIYTNGVHTADLIIPRKVNHNGELLSHNLTHHHVHKHYEKFKEDNDIDENDHKVHYHVDYQNETFHLELEPSTNFVAPLMTVERHKRDLKQRYKRLTNNTQCHYSGHIRGHENSKVALSACNGIAGYIITDNNEYWIEPSKNHRPGKTGHPHVMFNRASVKNVHDEDEKRNQQKKKKKRRKRRHNSNCGTKEPKRMTETKIEWQPQGKVIVQGGRKTRNHHEKHNERRERHNKNGRKSKKRSTRSVIYPRHVEALVVADPSMVQFHDDDDVETYLLTIMNMVSSLYKDPTIGNSVHVVVVKIILLEEEDSYQDLNVTHIAGATLESFCKWQRTLNPKDDLDPNHHDVAILITRKNICSSSGCSTLGIANVAGMCRADKSCSVNEDNGITLAHTIAHELGHNFGMFHDTAKTGCNHRIGSILHIMTPSFEADTIQVSWSNCSRRDITHFLDQGYGKCLEDVPGEIEYTYPELPPGAMYKADLQCRYQFNSTDEDIKVCSKLEEICSQLWCSVNDVCTTLLRPAAPGTTCGKHQWCQNQKCVQIEDLPSPIDGGWGNWSDWTECSRSCGAGVSKQTRECDHPAPNHGGSFCIGERSRYKICNTFPCGEKEPTYRAQQCTKYNEKPIKGKIYTWLPYFDTHEPCELYCTDSDDTLILPFGDSAADGTPCNIGSNDMCIDGICRKVGCDWVVDSNTTVDKCGICGGKDQTCTTISGNFTKKINMSEGYYEITLIPQGSRHILIEEMGPSKNYLGVAKSGTKDFYLNGDRLISMSGEYEIAGAIGLYMRENEQETLKIPGPIKDNLALYIVFKGKHKNLGIHYEYTLPSNAISEPVYYWKFSDWSPCTSTCGGGTQHRFPICFKRWEGPTDEDFCWKNAENQKPEKSVRECNSEPCPNNWWIGPWQPCEKKVCRRDGDPMYPYRKRTIMCVNQNEEALPDSRCENQERPSDFEQCSTVLPFCSLDDDSDNEINNTF